MSYKSLEIWKLSREVVIETHLMSLTLPTFGQLKKANRSDVLQKPSGVVLLKVMDEENTKADFTKFLIYSLSSKDETIDHLETLFETASLKIKTFTKNYIRS